MSKIRPTYKELETRLATAEPIVEALKNHQVDAVVGEEKIAYLLLQEVGEALRYSEADFSAMFNLAGAGMFQADRPAFRFTRVNRKLCEITGYRPAELLTRTYVELIHPQDRPAAMSRLARVIRGKTEAWSAEKRCVCKDGRVVWLEIHGAVLRDVNGRATRIMAMVNDITASKAQGTSKPSPGRPKGAAPVVAGKRTRGDGKGTGKGASR